MFPYIRQIKVNDCFTYQNFEILKELPDSFKHIILTGKNGSGKTTILNRIGFLLQIAEDGRNVDKQIRILSQQIDQNPKHQDRNKWEAVLKKYKDVELDFFNDTNQLGIRGQAFNYFKSNKGSFIYSFFRAHRKVDLQQVQTVTKETDFVTQLNESRDSENFIRQFKQYIVNKKVYEAFDYMKSKNDSISESKKFFDNLTEILRVIFKDKKLELEFVQESFEFYLNLSDGRKVTFNQLSEGFSAFLSILMDLLMRVDLIRKQIGNYSLNPPGIVLIDEPETHFHIEMQYEILPLLTALFPNIQLIIATHSPAIISSLEGALVFDLSSKSNVSNWILGSSYSELMVKHFGLENEFGPKADKFLEELNKAYSENNLSKLKELLIEYEDILTTSLRLEIESRIIEIESKKINNDKRN